MTTALSVNAAALRTATEDEVIEACESLNCPIEAKPVDLLEFWNRMLDLMGVPDEDGDVPERSN